MTLEDLRSLKDGTIITAKEMREIIDREPQVLTIHFGKHGGSRDAIVDGSGKLTWSD